jgi:RNA polymerase sigma factor (sigma-70 family)
MGDADVRQAFQATYGPLIYTFPMRIYHRSEDEASEFYLYVFENGRIYKRIGTFEGRSGIQFKTYLSYYVLHHLYLEWRRSLAEEDTVPLPDAFPATDPTPDTILVESEDVRTVERVLHTLDPERRLVLKLLALGTVELTPDDIRLIAQMAGRSLRETIIILDEIQGALVPKEAKARRKWQELHAVSFRIRLYQRQITTLEERIAVSRLQHEHPSVHKLSQEKDELERLLAWRYGQQACLREALQRLQVRPSYNDIARVLQMSLGTVCSRIARAREEFASKLALARGPQG